MADREIAVGDPHSVTPAEVGGSGVHVHVGGADVGDGGEDDGVKAAVVHPLFQVGAAGRLQAGQPAGQLGDVGHGRV